MISPPEHKIIVSPIGNMEASIMAQVGTEISRNFGFRTENLSLLKDIDFALDQNRNQYHSTVILNRLADLAPPHALKILAVCQVDLFIPVLTHVFGEARLGGKACIISTFRLQKDLPVIGTRMIYQNRVIKEAIHELGHTFKLRHCHDPLCGMHYCRAIGDVDAKSAEFCRYCKILLRDEIKKLEPQSFRASEARENK